MCSRIKPVKDVQSVGVSVWLSSGDLNMETYMEVVGVDIVMDTG